MFILVCVRRMMLRKCTEPDIPVYLSLAAEERSLDEWNKKNPGSRAVFNALLFQSARLFRNKIGWLGISFTAPGWWKSRHVDGSAFFIFGVHGNLRSHLQLQACKCTRQDPNNPIVLSAAADIAVHDRLRLKHHQHTRPNCPMGLIQVETRCSVVRCKMFDEATLVASYRDTRSTDLNTCLA
ncbi:uncharacterized protein K452DRAFT_53368 [Aplosporella prunicola CBS 121167]|uniref:Uncharacterized protein n=1 Tax=Aplosporella prunicola CBS 121167 TaxID=1176127 RepID=A0A6A6BCM8_9PEZI|nr:uncharacterized protein K452DRAFT_53368 [Aplosporella prunicola CBS 121167]KAF2140241.1 hypothetical protein K452DRAFT_53368 [Aplosporella prunicola CBS 121167]